MRFCRQRSKSSYAKPRRLLGPISNERKVIPCPFIHSFFFLSLLLLLLCVDPLSFLIFFILFSLLFAGVNVQQWADTSKIKKDEYPSSSKNKKNWDELDKKIQQELDQEKPQVFFFLFFFFPLHHHQFAYSLMCVFFLTRAMKH